MNEPLKIPSDLFQSLDDYHQALAVALAKKNRVVIEGNTPAAEARS